MLKQLIIRELSKTKNLLPRFILDNNNWYEKSWSGFLNPLFLVGYGCMLEINRRVKDAFRFAICFVKQDKMHWFWDEHDLVEVNADYGRVKIVRKE